MTGSIRGEQRVVRVIRDYTSSSSHPLVVKAGEEIRVGHHDDHWTHWVWCTTCRGHNGWVPEAYISQKDDRWVALRDYDATELSVGAGETLVVEGDESDWLWCTKVTGESGWIPAENVEVLAMPDQPGVELECPFCHLPAGHVMAQNELAFAIRDGYPVTHLHTLIIPKRHVHNIFDLEPSEVQACHRLLVEMKNEILSQDNAVRGFNVGINQGQVAGQTIFHCHIHLIPRRQGDVEQPRGGVRHVIPGKGCY